MAEVSNCPQCGGEMAADAPEGLCPECLLKAGMESQVGLQVAAADLSSSSCATAARGGSPFVRIRRVI